LTQMMLQNKLECLVFNDNRENKLDRTTPS
jgi:hypothetical protein